MFKDAAFRLNLSDEWFDFRDQCLREMAAEWCQEQGLDYEDDG